ncbi:MAG: type IV secretion system DNA-binding domain-containing protein [Rhodoblastus sp.]|uniref:type IV secretion system DNA-binding domain-containing protein n=1 Tax=Rhodoblastus sp. TaxID=1962975 RepID=UPI003FD7519A
MASAKDPEWKVIGYSMVGLLIIALAVILSPFVLIAGVVIIAFKLYEAHQNSPARLAALESQERAAFYEQATKPVSFPDSHAFGDSVMHGCLPHQQTLPIPQVAFFFAAVFDVLYQDEGFDKLPNAPARLDGIDGARYRDLLADRMKRTQDPALTIATMENTLKECLSDFHALLPPVAQVSRSKLAELLESDLTKPTIKIPLIELMPDVPKAVEALALPFFSQEVRALNLFASLRKSLEENQAAMSGNKSTLVMPTDFKGSPREVVRGYLKDTVFEELFDLEIPFEIPTSRFLEHAVLVAGSGHGKTQTLGALIARFLEQDDPPALVVVDSTGALVKKIETLALFNDRLKDRIVIIDPEHEPTPALNMFDVSNARMRGYSESMRASVETEIVQLFNYIFTSAQNDLTSRQGTVFSYVVRLVLSMPDSTIDTLRQVLEEDPKGGFANSRYRAAIEALDATAQDFFKNQYFELKGFREQIAQRVYGLVQVPAFQRMFATNNKVDFFDELQNRGSVIVVNTSESVLKQDASTLFGRYIIARTMAAAFERASIPQEKRRPTFLIIDEAAPYFDDTFDKLLTRVRQFKLGVCVAFQHMEQASEKLRSSIASNTSVKMAGGLGYADSRWLARDMETTPEFLKAQRRDSAEPPQWTQLACYVRNFTSQAVSLTIPFFVLEHMPQMTSAEHRALLERNRMRVSSPPRLPEPAQSPVAAGEAAPPAPPPRAQKHDDDAAAQWH